MDLNIQTWKEFEIERLFSIKRGDRIVKDEDYFDIIPSDDYKYRVITASATNNGVDGVYNDFNCDGNCLISCGEANGMFTTWQNEPCWVLDTARIYTPKGFSLNEITGMFLATLLSANMYRFSYGRKAKPDNMYSLGLKLPIQHNSDGIPVIDADKTYSDEGYIPDWQFMEDYIKSLHSEPITTTRGRVAESLSLGVEKWKEFKLSTLFDLQTGKVNDASSLEDGDDCLYLGAKWNDNGVMRSCKRNDKLISKGNCIMFITDGAGSVGYSLYKDDTEFMGTINLVMGYGDFLNPKRGMFLATVICRERDRYSFGRKWKTSLPTTIIKLPIQRDTSGNPVIDPDNKYSDKGYIPDWDFMERYIDSLPYSDKIM